jgi:Zinc finger, C2H2 type
VESSYSFNSSQGFDLQLPTQTIVPSLFRRHSFAETGVPTVRAIGQKKKRELSDDQDYVANDHVSNDDLFTAAATGASGFVVPNVHMSKRRRSVNNKTTSSSAPALFPIPLPNVERAGDNYDGGSINDDNDVPPIVRPSAPSPVPATTPSTQRRAPRRRTGMGSGRTTRAKRTPCEYCKKTFSRVQDAQRHMTTSCAASEEKMGVECPECNAVLSRLDAAQRHWRGHENPTCPPPAWMNR